MLKKVVSRRELLRMAALIVGSMAGGTALGACQPKVVKETVVVTEEKLVKETVVVKEAVEVEKEVTRVVEKEVPVAAAPKTPVQLKIHAYLGYEADWHKERVQAFKELFPHIDIEVEAFPLGAGGVDYFTKLVALHASRTIGDLAWANISAGSMLRLGADGVWLPVNDFVEADNYDLGQFYETAVETFSLEGKLMGMPMECYVGGDLLIYNKDLFANANLAEPNDSWTVDDLTDSCISITADTNGDGRTDVWGTTHSGAWHGLQGRVHGFGGYIIEHKGAKTRLGEPEGRACVQWQSDLISKHKVAPTPDQVEEGTEQMFLSSKIATMPGSVGNLARVARISEGQLNYAVVGYPKGPSGFRGGNVGGASIPITSQSRHKEEAWEYAKWICNRENGVHRVIAGDLWIGGRPDVFNDARVLAIPGFREAGMSWILTPPEFIIHEVPANFRGPEVISAVNNNLDRIWTGQAGVDDGLAQLVEAVDKVLALPR